MTDPRVLPLQTLDSVLLHPLRSDSPAIDTGVVAGALPTDQRGVARDAKPDVGAFELLQRLTLTPNLVFAGSDGITLTVDGANFSASSRIRLDGSERTTTLVNSTRLTTPLGAADLSAPRTITVTVSDSALPGQPLTVARLTQQVRIPLVLRL